MFSSITLRTDGLKCDSLMAQKLIASFPTQRAMYITDLPDDGSGANGDAVRSKRLKLKLSLGKSRLSTTSVPAAGSKKSAKTKHQRQQV